MPDLPRWRRWLASHHRTSRVVWLVFERAGAGARGLTYDDALDEALCWGWIDSLVRRIDDRTYARKFTPRKRPDRWSRPNVERLRRLLATGRVRPAGLAAVADGVLRSPPPPRPPPRDLTPPRPPAELRSALSRAPRAHAFFRALAPSYRANYSRWVSAALRPATRRRRAAEAVRLLRRGTKRLLK
jgi:uncharacterized protein YdeI (YjbR/CyaY-like superfamily)